MKTLRAPLVAILTLLAAATLAAPAVAGSPAPDPSADPRALIQALNGLDALDSYRLTQTTRSRATGGEPYVQVTQVQNAPDFRLRLQDIDEGEVGFDEIVVGDEGWRQQFGGAWRPLTGQVPDASWPIHPRVLENLQDAGIELSFVGDATVDGREVRQYRGGLPHPPPLPTDPEQVAGPLIGGTLDLWVDAADGYLVRAAADVVDLEQSFPFGSDPGRSQITIDVTGVNDPAARIDSPDLTQTVQSSPTGDPALAETVRRASARLAELHAYRATTESHAMGQATTSEMLVVTDPEPRVHATFTVGGAEVFELVLAGESAWQRGPGDDRWTPGASGFSCGTEPCSARSLGVFGGDILDPIAETFTLIGTDEVDGTPATHLRSTAGQSMSPGETAPGATDLWVAKDDGRLLRLDFDGQGIRMHLAITDVNDPSIVIDLPTADEVAPSPSPFLFEIPIGSPSP
ncbi:MAG: hypothetical protein U0869_07975 [Chloroflexota bacterium]